MKASAGHPPNRELETVLNDLSHHVTHRYPRTAVAFRLALLVCVLSPIGCANDARENEEGIDTIASAQLWDGTVEVVDSSGKQVAAVFTTKHQSSATQCTYTENWYLLKGFTYIGSAASTALTFKTSTTQYKSADEFKNAMSAKGTGRLAVTSVVEEGACTGAAL